MTPLVDVAFLLLTFFMYTTSLITPQVMEMNVPKDDKQDVEVVDKQLLNLWITGDSKIFYAIGKDEPVPVDIKNLKSLAVERNLFGDTKNKMITAFKADPEAPYGLIVQVLDILNQAEGDIITQLRQDNPAEKRNRKFAVIRFTDEDKEKLKGL